MATPEIVRIFDTTLREGEQSLNVSLTPYEKIQIAEELVRLKVDIIETGFPATSTDNLVAAREVASHVHGPAVAALARASLTDIDAAWEAICEAERPVIHIFLATSEIHLKHRLKLTQAEALQRIKAMVEYARNLCPGVEFSAQDATRSDRDYLCRVCEVALRAGATTINLPDNVGYITPNEYADLFNDIRCRVPGIEDVVLSAHCYNDLGMATANTLAAIQAGARQVEVTINGLGERAGNAALEEIVMALRTRSERFGNLITRVDPSGFVRSSNLVSRLTGIPVQPNKAIVGTNAFQPEAGFYQESAFKHSLAYEVMTPQTVGWSEAKFLLGKHTSRYRFGARLRQLGFQLTVHELKIAYNRFVKLAEQKTRATDDDLIYIAESSKETPVAV